HPIMPFITEEIWRRVAPLAGVGGETLMLAAWPSTSAYVLDAAAESEVEWIKGIVLGVRQVRGEMDISPAKKLPLLVRNAAATDRDGFARHEGFLGRLAGLESLRLLAADEAAPPAAAAVVGDLTLLVPMAGLIDPAAEKTRLVKKLEKTRQEIIKATSKLSNANFVANAPPEVVEQERERIAQFERTAESLERQIALVQGLLDAG
ncbi:MAG: valyl-tRNA synthetase, partial [Pseudomonadota bacterium]